MIRHLDNARGLAGPDRARERHLRWKCRRDPPARPSACRACRSRAANAGYSRLAAPVSARACRRAAAIAPAERAERAGRARRPHRAARRGRAVGGAQDDIRSAEAAIAAGRHQRSVVDGTALAYPSQDLRAIESARPRQHGQTHSLTEHVGTDLAANIRRLDAEPHIRAAGSYHGAAAPNSPPTGPSPIRPTSAPSARFSADPGRAQDRARARRCRHRRSARQPPAPTSMPAGRR